MSNEIKTMCFSDALKEMKAHGVVSRESCADQIALVGRPGTDERHFVKIGADGVRNEGWMPDMEGLLAQDYYSVQSTEHDFSNG